tara:strand:+ start:679 stop:1638 length:960 start_codon:yes stop_codon:yes gene_type:complete
MNFRLLDTNEYHIWDKFVDSSPQGSIYAKSYYLESKGCDFSINVIENEKKILGGIVLCKNELYVHSNPLFIKYLGIIYASEKLMGPISKRRKYKIDRMLINNISSKSVFSYDFHPNFNNWINFYWNNFNQTTKYTYQIDLKKGDFRKNYSSKVRGPLNNAKNQDLKLVDISIEKFCDIIELSYKHRKTNPPYKKNSLVSFLYKLVEFKCFYHKAVIDMEKNVHAVAGIVYDENSSNLILNGSDPDYRKFSGNSLVIDHMIEFSSKKSNVFDFEGSMHERIEHFYFGFGGNIIPYYTISKNNFRTWFYLRIISIIKTMFN